MSAGPILPRGPRSVFAKLVAIMLIMAIHPIAKKSVKKRITNDCDMKFA